MANVALIERNSEVWVAREVDDNTLRRATPATFTTTGAGTADTLVSTSLVGTVAYDYIGNYIRFRSGTYENLWAEITAFVPGTDTITFEPAMATAPGTGITVDMWRNNGPTLRSASAGGGAGAIDAHGAAGAGGEYARDEVAGTWSEDPAAGTIMGDRYFVHGRGGTNNNVAGMCTEDANTIAGPPVEKVFTVPSVFAAGAAGDYAVLRRAVWPADDSIVSDWQLGRTIIERPTLRGASALGQQLGHEIGAPTGGSLPLVLELQPLQTAAGVSTAAHLARGPAEAGDILRDIFTVNSDATTATTGVITPAAAAATAITVTTATGDERFTTGNLVLIPATGEVGQIRDIADGGVGADTITVAADHLVAVIPSGATVQGGWCVRPMATGFGSHLLERWPGGRRILHLGWTPNLVINGMAPDGIAKLNLTGDFDMAIPFGDVMPTLTTPAGNRTPTATQVTPLVSRSMRVILGGTLLEGVIEVTLDVGYQFKRRGSIAGAGNADGLQYRGRATTGTIKLHMDNWTQINRWMQASALDLLVQIGNTAAGTFAFACPQIQFTDTGPTFEDGGGVHTLAFSVRNVDTQGTDTALEVYIPDLVLGWF